MIATAPALSPQGRAVLGAVRAGRDGQLQIPAVLRAVQRAGTRPAVARASLSRTLRRLWRAGLIESVDEAGQHLDGRSAAPSSSSGGPPSPAPSPRRPIRPTSPNAAPRGRRWRTPPPPSTSRRGARPPRGGRLCACTMCC